MLVMILETVPPGVRGQLTRWLIEPHPGTFVGHVSALVRDQLWEKCCNSKKVGGVIQIWSTNNEQHYALRMAGETKRCLVECEGITLIQVP